MDYPVMICPNCDKVMDPEDFLFCGPFDPPICMDCEDRYWQECENQLAVFDTAHGKCYLCGQDLKAWIYKDVEGKGQVICWPNCTERLPIPIRINNDQNKSTLQERIEELKKKFGF